MLLSSITEQFEEHEISIGEVERLLDEGFEVEVTSPDGWVPVIDFVDKGDYEEYVLSVNGCDLVRCNENHLFETLNGWAFAKDLLNGDSKFLVESGEFVIGRIRTTGKIIPIVDVTIDHENHRYYTNGVSSHNTAVGKSLAMCHFASAYLAQGKNVLYITLEMSEEKIAERLDFNLFDMVHDDITNMTKASFCSKVKQIADKTHGNLVIKEYPTAAAHAGHFRALIQELKLKKNFVPDVIFIDYLNICASSRIKGLGGSVNSYTLIKSIAEELRGLAVEFDLPIWSATQVTRSGFANTDIEITDTSESFGLPATADLMIALISTEQLEKMNQLMVKQLKNRYYDCNTNKRFTIGIDRSKMRLYDVEDPHANVMTDNAPQQTSAKTTPFTAGGRQKPNFNGFKT